MKKIITRMMAVIMAVLIAFTDGGIVPQDINAMSYEEYINSGRKTPKNGIIFKEGESTFTMYAGEHTRAPLPYMMYYDKKCIWSQSSLTGVTQGDFTYKSNNEKIATVSKDGYIQAKKKGTCKITMTSAYNLKIKGTFTVKVTKGKQKSKLTLEKTKTTLGVGKATRIKIKKLTGVSDKEDITYSSSDSSVACVNRYGIVDALKVGTATITVSTRNKKAKFKVTVKRNDLIKTTVSSKGKPRIVLDKTSVTLTPSELTDKITRHDYWIDEKTSDEKLAAILDTFEQGDIICHMSDVEDALKTRNENKYGVAQIKVKKITGLKSTAVTYKSSNKRVATVNSTGKVFPKRAGTAVITVTSKENKAVSATYKVTVKNLVTSFGFRRYTNLKKGSKYADYAYCVPNDAANTDFSLTSSNPDIVKIRRTGAYETHDYTIEAVNYGTVTLTLRSKDGYCKYSWKCTVTKKDTAANDAYYDKNGWYYWDEDDGKKEKYYDGGGLSDNWQDLNKVDSD